MTEGQPTRAGIRPGRAPAPGGATPAAARPPRTRDSGAPAGFRLPGRAESRLSPLEYWQRTLGGGRYLTEADAGLCLAEVTPITVSANGVEFDGRWFWNDTCSGTRAAHRTERGIRRWRSACGSTASHKAGASSARSSSWCATDRRRRDRVVDQIPCREKLAAWAETDRARFDEVRRAYAADLRAEVARAEQEYVAHYAGAANGERTAATQDVRSGLRRRATPQDRAEPRRRRVGVQPDAAFAEAAERRTRGASGAPRRRSASAPPPDEHDRGSRVPPGGPPGRRMPRRSPGRLFRRPPSRRARWPVGSAPKRGTRRHRRRLRRRRSPEPRTAPPAG